MSLLFLTETMSVLTGQGELRQPCSHCCGTSAGLERYLEKLSGARYGINTTDRTLQKKSVTKNQQHGVVFLKLGFGRKIRKVIFTVHKHFLLLALPALSSITFSAPGILPARLAQRGADAGHPRPPRTAPLHPVPRGECF